MSQKPVCIEISKPLLLAGRNGTFPVGPSTGLKDQWAAFMKDFGMIEGQIGLNAYGVCHSFDHEQNRMDYMCAVEVANVGAVPNYLFTLKIPARREAVFLHEGSVETIPKTWNRIFTEWLPASGFIVAPGPQYECYITLDEAGQDNSRIEIVIPVN
jgi:AraC family transcriptional regulator